MGKQLAVILLLLYIKWKLYPVLTEIKSNILNTLIDWTGTKDSQNLHVVSFLLVCLLLCFITKLLLRVGSTKIWFFFFFSPLFFFPLAVYFYGIEEKNCLDLFKQPFLKITRSCFVTTLCWCLSGKIFGVVYLYIFIYIFEIILHKD